MKKRIRRRMKCLILFNSRALTIKSIYRKKIVDGRYDVYIRFNEIEERYIVPTYKIERFKYFKRGDLVTIHEGNGGYFAIEKGNTVPQDGKILSLQV
ncbi:MAG: hypothetical protein E7314_05370 [Clostridiales bacterium]|nr:hypothetical protein [Clostridiales bacterium]